MQAIIGIDPGARTSGIAILDPSNDLPGEHLLVTNAGDFAPVPVDYLDAVIAAIGSLMDGRDVLHLALETVTAPKAYIKGNRQLNNPVSLIGTAMVYGAVRVHPWGVPVVEVRPHRNGSKPLGMYPDALIGPREKSRKDWKLQVGQGQLRHARSAYDVAINSKWTEKARQAGLA